MTLSQLLSPPRPIKVVVDQSGQPAAIFWRGRRDGVAVCNHWRVQGDWWREAYAREYYKLLANSGSVCTIYRDAAGKWYLEKLLD